MGKLREFWEKIKPSKRKLIQVYAALLTNCNAKGFIEGRIYTGNTKAVCVPGMNCYSCPGAVGACPLGSLQNALAGANKSALYYVIGILLLYCITFGRMICGWLCPAGLLQELLYKIKTVKLKKNKVTYALSYLKYVLLIVFVIILPLMYGLQENGLVVPAFCKYICPIGTFEGAVFLIGNPNNASMYDQLGPLFTWKISILIAVIVGSIFIYRFFCRFLCPLGALYGLFNKIAILGIKVDTTKCNHCSACISKCKMDVKQVGDHECIQCGECISSCAVHAIDWKLIRKQVHAQLHPEEAATDKETLAPQPEANTITENKEQTIQKTVKTLPKPKPDKNKIVRTSVISSVMIAALIGAGVYYNVIDVKKVYSVTDQVTDASVTLIDNTEKKINQDRVSYLYFYTNYSQDDFTALTNYASYQDLDIYFISNYTNLDANIANLKESSLTNFYFAKDNGSMSLYHQFTTMKYDSYSVCLDKTNTIFHMQQGLLNQETFDNVVVPSIYGTTIGNKVGDLCISMNLDYISEDKTFSLLQTRGKVTVLNFWYIDCGPCRQELPGFSDLQTKYPEDIQVTVVHQSGKYTKQDVIDYFNGKGAAFAALNLTYVMDCSDPSYYDSLGGDDSWPMTIIVNKEGIISFIRHGSLAYDELETQALQAMNQ